MQLYKGGSLSEQLGTADATAGTFAWTIPLNQATGNDYKVRIFQGAVEDYSDANFFIVTVRKYDLLGSWSSGVSSINSDTGAWNLITSSVATQIAAGDMDGDGKADLVGDFPATGLWVKYSSTRQWQFISSSPTGITVGDFNGDGKADLAGIWGGMVWLRDSATGSWTAGSFWRHTDRRRRHGWRRQSRPDRQLAHYRCLGAVFLDGNVVKPEHFSRDLDCGGDFNGDGKADLVGIWSNVVWIRDSATGSWTAVAC